MTFPRMLRAGKTSETTRRPDSGRSLRLGAHFQELKSTRIERGDPLVQGDFRWRNRSHRTMGIIGRGEWCWDEWNFLLDEKFREDKEGEKNFSKNETWYFLTIFFISFEREWIKIYQKCEKFVEA